MRNLNRQELMLKVVGFVRGHVSLTEIIFFGSITGDLFDEASGIDTVLIFPTLPGADKARRILYRQSQPKINHPIEFLCVDLENLEKKSNIGGVYMIAKESGVFASKQPFCRFAGGGR